MVCVTASSVVDLIIITLNINLFSPWYSWKIAELVLNNNPSLAQFEPNGINVTWVVFNLLQDFRFIWKVNLAARAIYALWWA